ncbi:CRISPR-associated helicase Cas3' [Methylobacterium sp. WL122]|nr:CRISPR-associated helicase Cas3' [Methylobacterium sp. WL122]
MHLSDELWAKRQEDGAWHSLVDHSADVSAVLQHLLAMPSIARVIGMLATPTVIDERSMTARLAALAFLHDVGKANRGFQARSDPQAAQVGHIDELAWIFAGSAEANPICTALVDALGLERIAAWLPPNDMGLFDAVFAHHGRPWALRRPGFGQTDVRNALTHWRRTPDDPIGRLGSMRFALDTWFGPAFERAPALPTTPAFQHVFAGLLMLADWLGSNPAEPFFPFANGRGSDRMAFALERAGDVLRKTGIDVGRFQNGEQRVRASFATAFGDSRRPFEPRPIQRETAEATAKIVVLESETGSGKTEAALWRFVELFRAGAVDGLYFALPTRVAATQIFERVKRFRDRVFPEDERPPVVLAIPGQMRVDEAEGIGLPAFEVQWNDDGDRASRWAAEHPKRYLTAAIAVGTIDQALLGSIRVRHAHLRAVSLLNKLLVVDEVHASNAYMERLLVNLLRFHERAGGHALLLSATLGSAARAHLLGASEIPDRQKAAIVPYPALSWQDEGREQRLPVAAVGAGKTVRLDARSIMTKPEAVAALALDAARAGATVLVIRNTVGQALATQTAVEELAGQDADQILFRIPHRDGLPVVTLHHARFAEPDRRLLDAAVEQAVGRDRAVGGLVLVGTQTLEQSLDIDADLLVSDLCPIDVLLQRIGRLHRHSGRERPATFAEPRAVVLMPASHELFQPAFRAYGLGAGERGGVYEDLRVVELTRRLIEAEAVWQIPAMNRSLVEAATHPEALQEIEAELSAADPKWRAYFATGAGRDYGRGVAAHHAILRFDQPFAAFTIEPDERIATRLGGADRHIVFPKPLPLGPFGLPTPSLKIPHHTARDLPPDAQPEVSVEVISNGKGFAFRLGPAEFVYDRHGLRRLNPRVGGEASSPPIS